MSLQKLNNFKYILPILFYRSLNNEMIYVVLSKNVIFSLNVLKTHVNYQYKMLSCLSGVDLLDKKYRFVVCYDLLSIVYNNRVRVKTFLNETATTFSSTSVYINANWWEREIWDLFGIFFDKHKDLRRILTDYGFEGHPMRKDFPLYGYIEFRYNENKKRIISEQVQLSQEFRFFTFETPW